MYSGVERRRTPMHRAAQRAAYCSRELFIATVVVILLVFIGGVGNYLYYSSAGSGLLRIQHDSVAAGTAGGPGSVLEAAAKHADAARKQGKQVISRLRKELEAVQPTAHEAQAAPAVDVSAPQHAAPDAPAPAPAPAPSTAAGAAAASVQPLPRQQDTAAQAAALVAAGVAAAAADARCWVQAAVAHRDALLADASDASQLYALYAAGTPLHAGVLASWGKTIRQQQQAQKSPGGRLYPLQLSGGAHWPSVVLDIGASGDGSSSAGWLATACTAPRCTLHTYGYAAAPQAEWAGTVEAVRTARAALPLPDQQRWVLHEDSAVTSLPAVQAAAAAAAAAAVGGATAASATALTVADILQSLPLQPATDGSESNGVTEGGVWLDLAVPASAVWTLLHSAALSKPAHARLVGGLSFMYSSAWRADSGSASDGSPLSLAQLVLLLDRTGPQGYHCFVAGARDLPSISPPFDLTAMEPSLAATGARILCVRRDLPAYCSLLVSHRQSLHQCLSICKSVPLPASV